MKRMLSERFKLWAFFSMAAILVMLSILTILLLKLGSTTTRLWLYCTGAVLTTALISVISALVWYKLIYSPFQQIERHLQAFSDEQISEELFDLPYDLSPGLIGAFTRLKRYKKEMDMLKLYTEQSQYLALQNQINPHFLYNTLDAIRGDALMAGMDEIARTTEALSTFFGYSVTKMDKLATVAEELENVNDFFYVQQYRFGNSLQLKMQNRSTDEQIFDLYLPRMTLQPIVENAISHGLESKNKAGTVTIQLDRTPSSLLIRIIDNGVGMPAKTLEALNQSLDQYGIGIITSQKRFGGIALNNVNCRIKLLFGNQYGIHIFSTPGVGTDVRITLPIVMQDATDEERILEN